MVGAEIFSAGAWSEASDGASFAATSPATGETLGAVAAGTREDAARAIAAAADVFPKWEAAGPFERGTALRRVAALIRERADELAEILSLDQGKPRRTEALAEVEDAATHLEMAVEDAVRLEGAIPASQDPGARILLLRRALGPVGVITPWNWPYAMPMEMIAPALAAGNTVVWTPAPSTSVCGAALAAAFADADLPPGVFNFVPGRGPVVGDEVAANPGTVMVTFVGSTRTGAEVARRAAGKRQVLELGNNGPLVVMAGSDLEAAAAAALDGCFLCAGQSCLASGRILVEDAIHEELVERLAAAMDASVTLGHPLDDGTTMGPLNNDDVAAKMDAHVRDAVDRGAEVVRGGERASGFPTDLYWEPTLLDGVPAESLAAAEETFGPIAPVMAIPSLDAAIELGRASGYGLGAAIFTASIDDALRFADGMRSGLVNVNASPNYFEWHLPLGGAAGSRSGIGRTGGHHILEQLTELQTVVIR